ncbi:uncharacterized protein N7458_003678 [Penicillium daleae]|uniref:carbonic anhydrase n=1 Tax=Penicillium daleae TaxID=63821 RepID=A0AAD6CCL7_9EURO|nr:uncharacterized protein N7458_003678 [Penicillium daleae]KAJ5456095.1 hypothetical protein N7458_003678 [Penicillium daleae]
MKSHNDIPLKLLEIRLLYILVNIDACDHPHAPPRFGAVTPLFQGIAVVGFNIQLSESVYSTPLFCSVFDHLDDISSPGTSTETGTLDFSGLVAHLNEYAIYQYSGSLTTPPCTEGVAWYVSAEPLALDVRSYNRIKRVLKFNSRYTQNALGRDNLLEIAAAMLN